MPFLLGKCMIIILRPKFLENFYLEKTFRFQFGHGSIRCDRFQLLFDLLRDAVNGGNFSSDAPQRPHWPYSTIRRVPHALSTFLFPPRTWQSARHAGEPCFQFPIILLSDVSTAPHAFRWFYVGRPPMPPFSNYPAKNIRRLGLIYGA
jgi:hypothetical protein